MFPSGLTNLARIRDVRSRRISSCDPTGGNRDFWPIQPGETRKIAEIQGAGCIRHIWMTIGGEEPVFARRIVLRMFWDDEPHPSVEVPIGDFFEMGFGMFKDFVSAPLQMCPADGRGMNCWFPMPFSEGAKIEVTNEGEVEHPVYFYIDCEEADSPQGDDIGYFHAQWRRENPTDGWMDPSRRAELHADIWKVWQSPER